MHKWLILARVSNIAPLLIGISVVFACRFFFFLSFCTRVSEWFSKAFSSSHRRQKHIKLRIYVLISTLRNRTMPSTLVSSCPVPFGALSNCVRFTFNYSSLGAHMVHFFSSQMRVMQIRGTFSNLNLHPARQESRGKKSNPDTYRFRSKMDQNRMNKFVPLSRSNERPHANLISHSDERRPTTSGSWTRFREDKIMIFFA